jgi:ATP-dependent DNA helicase DinG
VSFWNDDLYFTDRVEERKIRFKEIGEQVYVFFTEQATEVGFQMRDGQLDMSCEIVEGIQQKKHILVEAGVGIGKSFAYIVPVLLYIQKYFKPVVIATSTIALQEQLLNDIEIIKEMLDISCEVIIAKGQAHFLCMNRMDKCFTRQFIEACEEHKIMYSKITETGYEKADWDITVPDKIWNQINVQEYNPRFCRDKCSYHNICHYYSLRQRMLDTRGIIICNQDLLAVNMKKRAEDRKQLMSEDIGMIVVDEAHNLENRVRSSVTSCITVQQLKDALYGASKAVDIFDNRFTVEVETAEKLIRNAFHLLNKQIDQQDIETEKNGQDIERYYVKQIGTVFDKLKSSLSIIFDKVSLAFGDYVGDRNRRNFDEEIEKLEDCVEFLKSFIKRTNSEDIFWMERPRGNKSIKGIRLYKCPKEVNKIIRNILYNNEEVPVVLTSATMTSGKSINYERDYLYFMKNTGFPYKRGYISESKESPFNYDEHAMIYYTEHFPHPTKERIKFIEAGVDEIIKLLKISSGKALILFTAKTDLLEVYKKLMEEDLPFQIIKNEGNTKQAETLEKFRNDTNSVLLGTGSFWEGINIEGVSLSRVIIFRLPFPVREPIIDYKYSQTRNGLMDVSVPEMVIKLKQGIGRLIRSESDKGIVSIIDSRVGDTSYVPYKDIIWESLPIKNKTNSIEEIKKFYDDVVDMKRK